MIDKYQALDFAYGNLAASSNHRPTLEAFRKVATGIRFTELEFEEWARSREWKGAANGGVQ